MDDEMLGFAQFRMSLLRENLAYDTDNLKYLYSVARLCAAHAGVPVAAATAIGTSAAGAVTLPVVGAVPGWVAGALAGFLGGTTACMIGRGSMKPALDRILDTRGY